jgi:hypothetical protein
MPAKRALPQRTEAELRDAITHIAYERVAFQEAFSSFTAGHMRRLSLEAALVHARNFVDFFWSPIRKRRIDKDGVYAWHFVAGWKDSVGTLPSRPNELYSPRSAQLAHISIRRTSASTTNFAVELLQLASDLTIVWVKWRAALDSTWRARLDAALNNHQSDW